ncbi:isomerase [Pseudorhodoferax aquiterrae]|uniref:2-hydroxychromene-2-carboxylate isomerase n=1 Tax=Pseudorhodoferax aquiterrae TaxID=747304 RepID=A0ABQ3FX96_9BURK|nr:2-hydroxychromene-2-carboxylate isomerase [Pseudorhodoferax aquiterrae]GHC74525.1 isomerase [Pseudorhodoferax aquiterrae]
MKQIDFYLDFLSPYAYIAFETLPVALQGLSYQVQYRPVLLGAVLRAHGLRGPAEIPAKRAFIYRQVLWLAHQHGVPMDLPAEHPFPPLPLLRLALACGAGPQPNRYVCETVFRHVWRGGADASAPERLQRLAAELAPVRDPAGEAVKAQLRANTEAATAAGVFGVPALVVDGRVFWGLDALPMLRAYLEGDAWFATSVWDDAPRRPSALDRLP